MNTSELLEALKKKLGLESDYALARDFFKVHPNSMKRIREMGLSEERALQVATALGLDPVQVLTGIRAERAKSDDVRKVWEKAAKSLKSAAAGLVAVAAAYLAMRWVVDSGDSGLLLAGLTDVYIIRFTAGVTLC